MSTTGTRPLREKGIGELLSSFASDTTTLLSQEVELSRAEVAIQANRAKAGAGLFGAAAVIGLAALGALTACATIALALVLDWWLASLIVGAALLALAGVFAPAGRSRAKSVAPPVPERAIEGLRRDAAAVQEGVQAGRHDEHTTTTSGGVGHGAWHRGDPLRHPPDARAAARDVGGDRMEDRRPGADPRHPPGDGVRERIGSARESASGVGHAIAEHAPSRDGARRGVGRAAETARGNPMAIAAGALALGVVAGALMPCTRAEDEAIGPMAKDLRSRASDVGQDVAERGREAVREAGGRDRDAAQEAGDRARGAAHEAGDRARETTGARQDG